MESVYIDLALVALAAMLSPTTLSFSLLALIFGDRPLRTGLWFLLGAFSVTVFIGVIAAFVLGDAAASSTPSTPKAWVAVLDLIAAGLIIVYTLRLLRRPRDPRRAARMGEKMTAVVSSPAIAIAAAGATLANPGGFIPLALKDISETKPSTTQYVIEWLAFTVISLLPLMLAIVMLAIAPERTRRTLDAMRDWLERHARSVAAVILLLLAASLLRAGIAGLTS